MMDKCTRKVAASGSCILSTDQSMKSPVENVDKLNKKNNIIWQTMRSEIERAQEEMTHIVQLQNNVADEGSKAEKKPFRFIAEGTKSTVYEIPESFGGLILKVGPWAAINQERLNILRLEQAYEKVNHLIWNGSQPKWLNPLLFPVVRDIVPTGWVRDVEGLLRPCKSLDPRIPGFYDADGNRMSVDSQDHIGLVLSRIGDLADSDRREVLETCYSPKDPHLEEVSHDNDHCLIRIYLGRISDEDQRDDIKDSASDVIMGDAADDTSITSFALLSTLNLPGYLDHIIKACGEHYARPPLESFAREIAFGYAMLHWGAGLDGRGIEFLLGMSPTGVGRRLYMLDFEDCCPIGELTARCVRDQLVPAALENDAYIPRATSSGSSDEFVVKEKRKRGRVYKVKVFTFRSHEVFVWKVFVKHYLEASWKIWEARGRDFDFGLPALFIIELKKGFFAQKVERNTNGVSNHNVASEDRTYDQVGQDDNMGAEQDESHSQEADPLNNGADEDNRS